MSVKMCILGGILVLVVLTVGGIFYSQHWEARNQEEKYRKEIDEGYALLAAGGEDNIDGAVQHALAARAFKKQGDETYLLLGRAFNEKRQYKMVVKTLEEALSVSEDMEYRIEYEYYLGLAYMNLFFKVKRNEHFSKAVAHLSTATGSPFHRGDAYFGLGLLQFDKYKANPVHSQMEKAANQFQSCVSFEKGREGYEKNKPESPCPLCRKAFQRKSEDPKFREVMEVFNIK